MNNIDQKLWTYEGFYNPFGPTLLQLKINEDIRLKLLDSVISCLNDHKPMHFTAGNDRLNNAVKNSIVDGKIGEVSKEWQEKHPGNIIKNTIQSILDRYGELYYNMPCISSIADIWYVMMKAGDFHMLHSHVGSDELSGSIYLEVPDNLSDPQGNICWSAGGSSGQLYNSSYEYSPEQGDVLLWPAWLMHTVYPFRSKQERIMISFNGTTVCR